MTLAEAFASVRTGGPITQKVSAHSLSLIELIPAEFVSICILYAVFPS